MPRRRDLSQVRGLSRIPLLSYAQKATDPNRPRKDTEAPPTFPTIAAFLPQHLWKWLTTYLSKRLGPRHPFQTYRGADRGIYRLEDEGGDVRIALVGDWGTGTDEAFDVAEQVNAFRPHYTIHLGDVYYVGDTPEVEENCLGKKLTEYDPCTWPWGSAGSFALTGNHEMYARGFGYFDTFLPTLGLKSGVRQQASFFCLENEYWRIIALDTGYNCLGIPLLENIPFWPFAPDCALPDELMTWLRDDVRPDGDSRGLVLLSHHQYFSSFEAGYTKPATQLRSVINRPVIWWWGHEHRMAVYDKQSVDGGIEAYGRCIGHGGMPVELSDKAVVPPLIFYDNEPYANDENLTIGRNGHANVTLTGNIMTIDYVDLKGQPVFSETWQTNNGVLTQLPGAPARADGSYT
jgi:hypothetical protein